MLKCIEGKFGFFICATIDIPDAQYFPSLPAPNILCLKYFENYFGKVSFSSQKSNLNEKKYLSIDAKKFLKDHKFKNMLNFRLSNEFTCEWYRQFYNSENMISFTKKQILLFKNLSKN